MQTYELKNIQLFRTFSLEDLYVIAEKITDVDYKAGEIIFQVNDIGDAFYIINEGTVQVIEPSEDGRDEVILAELEDGDYFGEMALLMAEPRTATIKAKTDTKLYKLLKTDFQALLDRNASMYKPIAYVLAKRLKDGNLQRLFEKQAYAHKYTPTGHLDEGSLIEILKYCEDNALSGFVRIVRPDQTGVLKYERGGIVNIELDGMNPDQALDTMLKWDSGQFTIEPKIFRFGLEKPDKTPNKEAAVEEEEDIDLSFTRNDLIAVANLIVQFSVKLIGKTIVYNFLYRLQHKYVEQFDDLKTFQLTLNCDITLRKNYENQEVNDEEMKAAALWMKQLISECSKYEIKFESFDVQHATRSYQAILEKLNFYKYYKSS